MCRAASGEKAVIQQVLELREIVRNNSGCCRWLRETLQHRYRSERAGVTGNHRGAFLKTARRKESRPVMSALLAFVSPGRRFCNRCHPQTCTRSKCWLRLIASEIGLQASFFRKRQRVPRTITIAILWAADVGLYTWQTAQTVVGYKVSCDFLNIDWYFTIRRNARSCLGLTAVWRLISGIWK